MEKSESKTIVFIHGLFQNPDSWKHWQEFFEKEGYTCHAPAYPYHEGDPAYLRKNIDPDLGRLTFGQVTRHLAEFIDRMPEKPILIGHSIGGLLVQKLIEMERGIAGVSIDPAPPEGIISFKWSFFKANFPTINPLKGNSVCLPSAEWFHYAFCNTMTLKEAGREYDRFVVPESRNIPRSTAFGGEARIDFNKPHRPLLIIAGEKDNIIPSSLNRKNFNAYKHRESRTDFKEFPGRTHYICGQKNWKEVASYVSDWIRSVK